MSRQSNPSAVVDESSSIDYFEILRRKAAAALQEAVRRMRDGTLGKEPEPKEE